MVLRIFLIGLVALVPEETSLRVILRVAHHTHEPVFVWNWEDQVLPPRVLYPRPPVLYWPPLHLSGQEITIRTTARPVWSTPALNYEGGRTGGPSDLRLWNKMPRERRAHDFRWVPSMEILTDGLGFIDLEYYEGKKPELVAGRLEIDRGNVSTFSFADIGGQVRGVKFSGVGRAPMFTMRQECRRRIGGDPVSGGTTSYVHRYQP